MILQLSIVLFGATLFYISTTSRLGAYVKILSIQGVLLFMASLSHSEIFGLKHTLFITFETLVVKAVVLPLFIRYIIDRIGIRRETEPYIDNTLSLMFTTIIVVFSLALSVVIAKIDREPLDVLVFGISFAAVVTGLFIMISRKKLITHVMGYLVLENGVFLMSLALAADVPIAVEAGVLLDVFMGVFLMGILLNKIKSSFEIADITELTELADVPELTDLGDITKLTELSD